MIISLLHKLTFCSGSVTTGESEIHLHYISLFSHPANVPGGLYVLTYDRTFVFLNRSLLSSPRAMHVCAMSEGFSRMYLGLFVILQVL